VLLKTRPGNDIQQIFGGNMSASIVMFPATPLVESCSE
jgi:hypothetical protein